MQIIVTYNVFGRHQRTGPVRKIVPRFMAQLLSEGVADVYGDGTQIVDLVYAADSARELLLTSELGTLHAGAGRATTVNEAVMLCAEALGMSRYEARHTPMRKGKPAGSTSLSPNGYRYATASPLPGALAAAAAWYRAQLQGPTVGARRM